MYRRRKGNIVTWTKCGKKKRMNAHADLINPRFAATNRPTLCREIVSPEAMCDDAWIKLQQNMLLAGSDGNTSRAL